MQLTNRDRRIISLVWAYRYLTRLQMQKLLFSRRADGKEHSQKNIVTRRLMLLYQNGYLDRIHSPIAPHLGSSPIVYCLARKGARFLAMEKDIEVVELPWQRRQRDRALLFLQHNLAINDFRIAVTLAADREGHEIPEWLDERSLSEHQVKAVLRDIAQEVGRRGAIVPDAYFTLSVGARRASFFLEVDRGHTEGRRIREKVRIYRQYYDRGLHEQHFDFKRFRVVTVTTSDRRLASLKGWAEAEAERTTWLFWFTTFGAVQPEAVLTEPIWEMAGEEGHRVLV